MRGSSGAQGPGIYRLASLVVQTIKNLLTMQETWVRSLGWEDPLEKGMATHSSVLAWRIPWTEEPGGLQSVGLQSRTRLRDSRLRKACNSTCVPFCVPCGSLRASPDIRLDVNTSCCGQYFFFFPILAQRGSVTLLKSHSCWEAGLGLEARASVSWSLCTSRTPQPEVTAGLLQPVPCRFIH